MSHVSWDFDGASIVNYCGGVCALIVPSWCFHWTSIRSAPTAVLPWTSMMMYALPWCFYGLPWCFHCGVCAFMVLSWMSRWRFHGLQMVLSWTSVGAWWCVRCHGTFMGLSWTLMVLSRSSVALSCRCMRIQGAFSWSSSMVLSWWCVCFHGICMVLSWCFYSAFMVPPWTPTVLPLSFMVNIWDIFYGLRSMELTQDPMVLPRYFYCASGGFSWTPMVLSWIFLRIQGASMRLSWCIHGASAFMVLPWDLVDADAASMALNESYMDSHGAFMVLPWIPMVLSWWCVHFHGAFMDCHVLPPCFHCGVCDLWCIPEVPW